MFIISHEQNSNTLVSDKEKEKKEQALLLSQYCHEHTISGTIIYDKAVLTCTFQDHLMNSQVSVAKFYNI
jgi:hypothetical protein